MPKNRLVLGDYNATCDVCGFEYKASQLRQNWKGQMVCSHDYESRHPSDLFNPDLRQGTVPWSRPEPPENYISLSIYGLDFTADVTTGESPLTVTLTATTTVPAIMYSSLVSKFIWTITNGTTTDTHTTYTPVLSVVLTTSVVDYTVTCTMYNQDLVLDTVTRATYIDVYPALDPAYAWINYTAPLTPGDGTSELRNSGQRWFYDIDTFGAAQGGFCRTTVAISGKKYCEFKAVDRPAGCPIGFGIGLAGGGTGVHQGVSNFYQADAYSIFDGNGGCGLVGTSGYYANTAGTSSASYAFAAGDTIGIAFDATTRKLWFSKNGVWISGDPAAGTGETMTVPAGTYYFYGWLYTCAVPTGDSTLDIKQVLTTYTAPSGFDSYQPYV